MRKIFRKRSARDFAADDRGIKRIDNGSVTQHIAWSELSEVAIRTVKEAPRQENAYWIFKRHGREAMLVPNRAARRIRLVEQLQALPGFDTATAVEALTSKHDEVFVCWQAPTDS